MIDQQEITAYCALGHIFGFNPVTARRIISTLGSAASFFALSDKERRAMTGPFSGFEGIDFLRELENASNELERLRSEGKSFLAFGDERFPQALSQCPDCPMGLYFHSVSRPEDIFTDSPFISIVGTRDITPYGREWCRKIVAYLSSCPVKPVIVSGFAIGTDIEAHTTALECGLKTIAVLPTGIDAIYPYRHHMAAQRLASSPGCALVTDYPPGTPPQAINFLRRNRIIAGLSSATILIESKEKGGGLITTGFAFDYDRDVFALPGRIDDMHSCGCNAIIASSKARLISSPVMLARELGLGKGGTAVRKTVTELIREAFGSGEDADNAERVLERIRIHRGITPEEIAEAEGWPYRKALEVVVMLENKDFIETDLLQRCMANKCLSLQLL